MQEASFESSADFSREDVKKAGEKTSRDFRISEKHQVSDNFLAFFKVPKADP